MPTNIERMSSIPVMTALGHARTSVAKGDSPEDGAWEYATRPVPAKLRRYVREISGYFESTPSSRTRPEFPGPVIVMIVEFGPPLAIFTRRPDESVRFTGGFVAGICTGVTQTRHEGLQAGVQIGLTPLGAFQLLRRPIAEIAELAVGLRPFLPRRWRQLDQMLAEAPDWDRRFDLVEAALSGSRLTDKPSPPLPAES